ncbi:outer membrane receptor protein involved in Fe transport [Lewinella aquimaris]|uniref:Outer membrane receptor protein involved in Fe transport n=1 Tax=Neolewinella aquimaris TaxID=1835722 RepID=A0A840E4L3_9BACT|nr:outer membrane beta-barrel family protein [Neolewinella aquimaris]MBB4078682.1 outer membrane receptor protein involved in Fe transport [Neolewinella aquimaris]
MPTLTRRPIYIAFLMLLCTCVRAQGLELKGRVVESGGELPVEFATVKAIDPSNGDMLTGTTTDVAGNFTLTVPQPGITLEVSFLGFAPTRVEDVRGADMGTIVLKPDGETLDEVLVTGERSTTEFRLDKRVFNVGKDLSSSGASALEVLNNVPSVTVSIEGQINLRGSGGVQILIDGKPSVLTADNGNALGTITADMIESVEVITNPSAKYQAEGTAGIINIVLKKEEQRGLNGSVTVNTGTPNNHSLGLSVNRRTAKFNLFGQLGVGYRTFPEDNRGINRDLSSGTTILSEGEADKNEQFYNLILGTDYHINDRNVLSLTGHLAYEIETENAITDFSVINSAGNLTDAWRRTEATEATNPKWQYELNYKREFDAEDKDHVLIVSALGNSFTKDQSSEFTTNTSEGEALFGDQLTRTDFGQTEYTFKADYTRPVSEAVTLETGLQYVLNDVGNDFAVSDFIDDDFQLVPELTNRFEFQQGVLGAYVTSSYEGDKWGVKAGLRVEQTDLSTVLVNTQEANDQNYTNLFPTLHTSYKFSEAASVQAGYSRRVFRPRLWDLNPFFNIRNNFNVRAGNPNLQPEFTDSYEVTGILIVGDLSLNAGIYHRYTTDVVERVSFFQDNVNVTQPINLGTSRTNGVELNGKYRPAKWMTLSGDFNFNAFDRTAELEGVSYDFSAEQFNGRLVTKFELPLDIDFEVAGNVRSGYRTVQGNVSGFSYADIGLRKKILKGRMIFNVSVRDAFASMIDESEATQPDFYLYNYRQRGRFVTVGLSYGFGKGEAMEFGGQKQF